MLHSLIYTLKLKPMTGDLLLILIAFPLQLQIQALFKIGRGEPPHVPNTLSSDAQDFICRCLKVDPNARPTASQLLEHPFVKHTLPSPLSSPSPRYLGMRF